MVFAGVFSDGHDMVDSCGHECAARAPDLALIAVTSQDAQAQLRPFASMRSAATLRRPLCPA